MICKRCKSDNFTLTIFKQNMCDGVITLHIKNVCGECGKIVYTNAEYVFANEYEVNPPQLEIPQ